MQNKRISVLMSTYNETACDIHRAVSSILNQTYEDFEFLIVCDNPDNTELVEELKNISVKSDKIILIINEKNMGLTSSLNKAINLAQGEFIARMDADDESMPERLEKQMHYLVENQLDLVGCYVECVNEKYETICYLNNMPKTFEDVKRKILYNNPIAHPTWLGKKDVFINNKGYRNVPYAEDYDFLLRAFAKGYKLGNVGEVLFRYTMRPTSISNSNGLKQYLISKKLIESYKKQKLDDLDVESLLSMISPVTQKEQNKYAKAAQYFSQAVTALYQKKPVFIIKGFKACFTSKYYFAKIIGLIRAFL